MKIFSYGGGVQSTACLILSAQGKLAYKDFVFANVGDDSEHPKVFEYLNKFALPFAEAHGLKIHLINKLRRDGSVDTLWTHLMRSKRSIDIPVRVGDGAPGNRNCTATFKINVISQWAKRNGATKNSPALVGIGISMDEIGRMNTTSKIPHIVKEHPLIDLRLRRTDCEQLIKDAGLPVPPKSSCFFCPYKRPSEWQEMYTNERPLFDKSVELERILNERRAFIGKDAVWLSQFKMPLDKAIDGSHEKQTNWLDMLEDEGLSCSPFACSGE